MLVQVLGGGGDGVGVAAPLLGVGLDRARVAGEHVEGVVERLDVFHQPGDAGADQRIDRVRDHAERVEPAIEVHPGEVAGGDAVR